MPRLRLTCLLTNTRLKRRWARIHAAYSPATLAASIEARAANIVAGSWSFHGLPGLAILIAVTVLPIGVSRFALGMVLCLFGVYLAYAHDPTWTLYYLELEAPLAFLTAVGLWRLADSVGKFLAACRSEASRETAAQRNRMLALGAIVLVLAAPTIPRSLSYRLAHAEQRRYREEFERAVESLPADSAIVFIPYDTSHGEARLMQNVPALSMARVWIAHDCGAENVRLTALAPRRRSYFYRFDTAGTGHLEPFTPVQRSEGSRDGSESNC